MPLLSHDVATRERLLEAAKRLFSERGFEQVTVREVCREAGANVALVNYYFGDKLGLYNVVVDEALAALAAFNHRLMAAPEDATPEAKLGWFIRGFLEVALRKREGSWLHRFMQHELGRPTEAAERVVRESVAPRMQYLSGVIAELLDCPASDPRVLRCVGSVHGLCVVYLRMAQTPDSFIRLALPNLRGELEIALDEVADHVARFALAGIRAVRTPKDPTHQP